MTTNDLWKQINPFLTRVQAQSHANHLNYISFFTRRVKELIIDLLDTDTPQKISDAYALIEAAREAEDVAYKAQVKSPITAQLAAGDEERDNHWLGTKTMVEALARIGTAEQKAAAERFLDRARANAISVSEAYEKENTHIIQFIQECETTLAPDVTALGITQQIATLKQQTQALTDLILQRNLEQSRQDPKAMQKARQATDDAYVRIVSIVNAYAITGEEMECGEPGPGLLREARIPEGRQRRAGAGART